MKSTFGKGTYFIGDICYILDDKIYDDFWGKKNDYEDGEFKIKGSKFAVGRTAYGDGLYRGTDGVPYGVDAGVIGVVPEKLWDKDKYGDGGRIVRVRRELVFETDGKGIFEFKVDNESFTINTRD